MCAEYDCSGALRRAVSCKVTRRFTRAYCLNLRGALVSHLKPCQFLSDYTAQHPWLQPSSYSSLGETEASLNMSRLPPLWNKILGHTYKLQHWTLGRGPFVVRPSRSGFYKRKKILFHVIPMKWLEQQRRKKGRGGKVRNN